MLLRVHCSDFHTQNTAASTSDAVELSESTQRNAYSDIGNCQPKAKGAFTSDAATPLPSQRMPPQPQAMSARR